MRALVLLAATGLLLLSVPPPAAAVMCMPEMVLEDPVRYVSCQFGCELGALLRFAEDPRIENLFVACPA